METTTKSPLWTVTVTGFIYDGVLQERIGLMLDDARLRHGDLKVTYEVDRDREWVTFTGDPASILAVVLQYTGDDYPWAAAILNQVRPA